MNERVADWCCSCGHWYRVAIDRDAITLWPHNSRDGFRAEPIPSLGACVNGCEIDRTQLVQQAAAA